VTTGENLEPGDILVNTVQHTAIYMGNNKMVAARINENGGVSGGQTGDQTGEEIMVETYSNHPWDSVYRATK
jgi:cell wall-associated NlpC family hydrolase